MFEAIDDFFQRMKEKSIIPNSECCFKKEEHRLIEGIEDTIPADRVFLDPLKNELTDLRLKYIDRVLIDRYKTKDGDFFYKIINSLLRIQEFPLFIDEFRKIRALTLEKFSRKPNYLYYFLLSSLGFGKNQRFLKTLQVWHERLVINYSEFIQDIGYIQKTAPGICTKIWKGVFTNDEIAKIDAISNREGVIRGLVTNDGEENILVMINKVKAESIEGSRVKGILYSINKAYTSSEPENEVIDSEVAKFILDRPIPSSRALKLCTNNSWIKADLIIRNLLKDFFAVPFLTKARGMEFHITVYSQDRYHIVIKRFYKIYKRHTEDDPTCLTKAGKHLGKVHFLWRVHCSSERVKGSLYIDKWNANPKTTWEDQVVFLKNLCRMSNIIKDSKRKKRKEMRQSLVIST